MNKTNAKFFEQWLQASTARKARSNFEYFLVETKIYDPLSRTIHLELDDGWLQQAAIAAAQYEKDAVVRDELLIDSTSFLEKRGWLGLLNISPSNIPRISPLLSTDSVPIEDEQIKTNPLRSPTGNDWGRSSPTSSGRRTTIATIDLVARERANKSHFTLEEILAAAAKRSKLAPKCNQNVDMYFDSQGETVLVEIKSCVDSNFHSQIRKGISQLLEYRFVYQSLFRSKVTMLLLMETAPPKGKKWLVDYVSSLGIVLAWKQTHTQVIESTCSPPKILSGIVTQAKA